MGQPLPASYALMRNTKETLIHQSNVAGAPGATEQFFAGVLDYYRSPLSHPLSVNRAQRIPREFSDFLESFARPEERLTPIAQALGCRVDELLAASYFYIRQMLFLEDGDHYRLLGLSADAGIDDIRRRYRVLISLFHPDRIRTEEQWEAQFVRRLNLAYGVLKRAEKRCAYDQQLQRGKAARKTASAKTSSGRAAGRKTPRRTMQRAADRGEILYRSRFLQRQPVFVIWLGAILLLALLLLIPMLTSRTTTLILAESDPEEPVVADRVPVRLYSAEDLLKNVPMPADSVPSGVRKSRSPGTAMLPMRVEEPRVRLEKDAEMPGTVGKELREKAEVTKTVQRGGGEPADAEVAKRVTKSVRNAPTTANLFALNKPVRQTYRGFDGTVVSASMGVEESGQSAGQDTVFPATESQLRPEYVLTQYVRAYESGDLNLLLSLFTLDPETNMGVGRNHIRDNYARVFQQTRRRRLEVEQVTVSLLDNDVYQIKTGVRVANEAINGGNETRFHGEMLFQLIRKGRKMYITSLFHNVTDRPERP